MGKVGLPLENAVARQYGALNGICQVRSNYFKSLKIKPIANTRLYSLFSNQALQQLAILVIGDPITP